MIKLKLKVQPNLPVEAESINPESFAGKTAGEILEVPIWCGNSEEKVGDYFEVTLKKTAKGELPKVVLKGNLERFKRLGQGMGAGEMEVESTVGFHAGAFMRGGKLTIKGDAGDWLGSHMEGGLIFVEGSVGNYVAAAQRGRDVGMTGGAIIVKGNAGQMLGSRMRRGLIAVGGDCGDAVGFKMAAGTILVKGKAALRAGANMKRGTIIIFEKPTMMPTFYKGCEYKPVFWKLLCQQLREYGFALDKAHADAVFTRYTGDANTGGKGEILTCLT